MHIPIEEIRLLVASFYRPRQLRVNG